MITKLFTVFIVCFYCYYPSISHSRTILTGSDLVFDGAFKVPTTMLGDEFSANLAIRHVNGTPTLFIVGRDSGDTQNPPLYEISIPASLKKTAPWTSWTGYQSQILQNWGKPFADIWAGVRGLYYDSSSARLYYSSSDTYIAGGVDVDAPTMAYLKLDDDTDIATSFGRWGFSGRSLKMVNNGIIGIPSDFQSTYAVGPLAAGFGGSQSAWATGPVSPGPALTSFFPPADGAEEGVKLSHIPLVSYTGTGSWDSGQYPTEKRCWRPDTHISLIYGNSLDPDGSTDRYSGAATFNTTTDTITTTAKFFTNHRVYVLNGTCPGGIACSTSQAYWPVNVSGDNYTFQLSLTEGGSPIDITSSGSGASVFNFEYWFSGDETLYWQGNSANSNSVIGYRGNQTVAVGTKHWLSGKSFWSNDYIKQGAAWIQTANKEGIVVLANLSTGLVWYFNSQPHAEGQQHQWLIYSPEQLGSVASGATAENNIQPDLYDVEIPGVNYNQGDYNGEPKNMNMGMAYDSVNQKLYVSVRFASGDADNTTIIYRYSIDDSATPALLRAPTSYSIPGGVPYGIVQ